MCKNQTRQPHHRAQVRYNNYRKDKCPYHYDNITFKGKKLKIIISNYPSFLWSSTACGCKFVCTGSIMATRNSGTSRPLFKNLDQIEVNLAVSSSMERQDMMELDTPTANLKRLIAEKVALKVNKKTKSQALLQISVPDRVPHLRYWLGFSTMEQLAIDSGIE